VIIVALQRPVLVHVDAPGHAVRGHHVAQDAEVARGTLLLDEVRPGEEFPGRIVDRRH